MFTKDSRYHPLRNLTYVASDGREIAYRERRLVPRTAAGGRTTLGQGERLDLVARRILGDPRLFWRLCDANEEIDPFEFEAHPGRALKLPAS